MEVNIKISTKSRLWAGLSYLGPLIILIPLIKKQDDEFVKYHLKQGIVLIFAVIFVAFVGKLFIILLGLILSEIAYITVGWGAILIFCFVVFIYVFIGILNCQRGKEKPLPLIGKIADKIKL